MFFYIGDNCPINAMKQVEPRLFLDEGWSNLDGIWYKGYSTDCKLSESLFDILAGYQPAGKWCVIFNEQVYHPVLRGFPIYVSGPDKTNLKVDGFAIVLYQTPPAPNESELSIDEAALMIGDVLLDNTRNFYRYNDPSVMTAIFSAGLDTATACAVIDNVTKNYVFSYHTPTDTDQTIKSFMGTVREYQTDLIEKVGNDYWGYYHACYYKETNWNITGYYAEVYTYRDGEAINAIANYYGKRIDELAKEDEYLYWFLKRPNVVEKYKNSQMEFNNDEALKRFLWETIWYDHQMWNLDNNMFFSPFADLRIPEITLRLSVEDLAHTCVTGELQRRIIQRFKPELLALVSDYKNEGLIWKNFVDNFDPAILDPETKIISR